MSEEDIALVDRPILIKRAPYPPFSGISCVCVPNYAIQIHLPLRLTEEPQYVTARAAKFTKEQRWAIVQNPYGNSALDRGSSNVDAATVDECGFTKRDITQVYFSPSAYDDGFEIGINL